MNDRLNEIERRMEMQCDKKKVVEIVRKTIGIIELEDGRLIGGKQAAAQVSEGDGRGDVLQETVKEIKDRKDRERNVIVFNAPEPDTNLKDIRVRADLEMVRGLCNDACGMDVDTANDAKMVIRLGKQKEVDEKPRPIKVEMKDKDTKEGLFKLLWKLGEAEDKYKKLSIQQDWKKKEREE